MLNQERQSNFNGSNTFVIMKICSRQVQFELMRVNHSNRSGHNRDIFSIFLMCRYIVWSHQNRLIETILMSTLYIYMSP